MKQYLIKILVALDYLANAFAPASIAGMTISSHAAMARADGRRWGTFVAGVLDWIQPNHCIKAMGGDSARAQAVVEELAPYLLAAV